MGKERRPQHATTALDGSALAVGTMSGTSLDGVIEAALVRTDGDALLHRVAAHPFQYEDPKGDRAFHHLMKAAELAMRESRGALDRAMAVFPKVAVRYLGAALGQRSHHAGEAFRSFSHQLFGRSEASMTALIERSTDLHIAAVRALLRETSTDACELDLIGYHGQTLYHSAQNGVSVQVGDAQRIADACGRPTFREADLQAGGQGAPLAPAYHHALAQTLDIAPCVFVNLGGCSNVTIVGTHLSELIAFDAGPGNTLLDRFVNGRNGQPMDRDGGFALRGTVDTGVLEALERRSILRDGRNYLDLRPPKSLDVRDPVLVPELDALSPDGCATFVHRHLCRAGCRTASGRTDRGPYPLDHLWRRRPQSGLGEGTRAARRALAHRSGPGVGCIRVRPVERCHGSRTPRIPRSPQPPAPADHVPGHDGGLRTAVWWPCTIRRRRHRGWTGAPHSRVPRIPGPASFRETTDGSSVLVIFVDGTLADTWRDIADAVNATLASAGIPSVDGPSARLGIGEGVLPLLRRHLGPAASVSRVHALYDDFARRYSGADTSAYGAVRRHGGCPRRLAVGEACDCAAAAASGACGLAF